jgi:hypothetical protein
MVSIFFKKKSLLCCVGLHKDIEIGEGESIHQYLLCMRCGRRSVVQAPMGYQPLRRIWLNGGRWN